MNTPVGKLLSLLEVARKGITTPIEFSCPLEDEKERWFQAVGTVLMDKNERPLRGIGGIRSIQNEIHNRKNLENQARTDFLTKMFNRQYGERIIRKVFTEDKGAGALLVIDIDHFKNINDSLGHSAGDQVLKEFAEILSAEFRPEDVTSRWGGDEFIVFVRYITNKNIIALRAEKLCKYMNREFQYEGQSLILSISIGIAMANEAKTYQELFQKADAALYEVKKCQRNGYQMG